jgi:TRAP-type C4-dicarboxylate transport system substrate-binding protein
MSKTTKIRWVIAHEPIDLFLKAAQRFSNEVYKRTNGAFDIEIMSLTDYSIKYNNGEKITKHDLLTLMEENKVEMSQMYTYVLGNYHKDFWALDMPFLFKGHDHADEILEGPIGTSMLDNLATTSRVRGLAFTYSGGFKCLPSNIEIKTVEDFKNARIRTSNNPVSQDTFKAVGAEIVKLELEEMADAASQGVIDAGESSFIRVIPMKQHEVFNKVTDSEHSLLITSIIIADTFWNGLDAETQSIIKEAAFMAARTERREGVAEAEVAKVECNEKNCTVITMDQEQRDLFREKVEPLYEKYRKFFSPGLLDSMMRH